MPDALGRYDCQVGSDRFFNGKLGGTADNASIRPKFYGTVGAFLYFDYF